MRREIIEAVREMMDGSDEWCRAGRPCGGCDEEAAKLARAVLTAAVGALPSDEIDEHVRLSATGVPVFIEWHDLLAQLTGEATP